MEKIIFDLSKNSQSSFDFDGQIVKVKSYINMTDRNVILNAYFQDYAGEGLENSLACQYGLMLAILDNLTNVEIKDIVIDNIVDSGLWNQVTKSIVNLDSLYKDIGSIKEELRYQKSVGNRLNKILDKVEDLIGNISQLDLSEAGIKKLVESLNEAKGEIGKFYPTITPPSSEDSPVVVKKPRKSHKTTS